MSTERRDIPPLRRRGKGKFIALGLGLCAGIAGGMIYWRVVIEHQRDVRAIEPPPQTSAAPDQSLPERAIVPDRSAAQTPLPDKRPPAEAPVATTPPDSSAPPQSAAAAPAAPAAPIPGREPAQEVVPRPAAEEELWKAARASDKTVAYTAYLKKYPKGRYAATARERLERDAPKAALAQPGRKMPGAPQQEGAMAAPSSGGSATSSESASANAPSPSPEEELWSLAAALDQAPVYETYLGKYPQGRYAQTARDKLAKFKPAESGTATPAPLPATPDKPAAAQRAEPSAPQKAQSPPSPPAAPEPAVAGARKTFKLDDQTMVGEFNADPVTGAVSGRGKITWNNGDQFEGSLVRGVKQGKGQFTWANGQHYNGDWARDKPNGKGSISFANGNRYEGDVRDGTPHGKGRFIFSNGNRYEGDVKDGTPHGKGTIVFASGDRYEGEVRAGVQHGEGISRFARGDVYAGAWVIGKRQGHGRYTWANGSYWEGEFIDGKTTENGKLVRADDAPGGYARAPASGGDRNPAGSQAAGGEREGSKP
jgi:hypothetical protein